MNATLPADSGHVPDEVWRELRRRSRLLWWLLAASLPGIFFFTWLLDGTLRPSLLPLITLVFVGAIGVAGLRVASFACPRCGKPYFETWYFFQLLRRECAHCRLARKSGIPAEQ